MKRCTVTIADADGKRNSLELDAKSVHDACFRYNYEVVCGRYRAPPEWTQFSRSSQPDQTRFTGFTGGTRCGSPWRRREALSAGTAETTLDPSGLEKRWER